MVSRFRPGKGNSDRELESRLRVVGRPERVDVLPLGVDERALGVEEVQGGRAAEAVTGRGDPVDLARFGQQLVPDEERLAKRGRGARKGAPDVEVHLGPRVVDVRGELRLAVAGRGD